MDQTPVKKQKDRETDSSSVETPPPPADVSVSVSWFLCTPMFDDGGMVAPLSVCTYRLVFCVKRFYKP